jgi:hypothetical protein
MTLKRKNRGNEGKKSLELDGEEIKDQALAG